MIVSPMGCGQERIYALKQDETVIERLLSTAREGIMVSVITEAELRTGAAKSSFPVKTLRSIENFLAPLTMIEFTSDDAIAYATIRARLERAEAPIGPLGTLIAAQALARGLTVVSSNEREFRRVAGLAVESWSR
jgi:tRNA(fMet)-specific endonuclease VapC